MDHFKLKLTHCADDLTPVELVDEHLCHTFIHQLVDTLVELLCLHRVGILDIFEHFGGEGGEPFEVQFFAGSQSVADLEVARVGDADDVAGICLIDDVLFLSHEGCGGSEAHHFAVAHMLVIDVAFEFAGAHLDEGDTAAMVGIHIGVDLKYEPGEFLLLRTHFALLRHDGAWRRGDLHKAV